MDYKSPVNEFRAARRGATIEEILGHLTGRPSDLLCYEEVRDLLHAKTTHRVEHRDIPIDAIAGSVERCTDYTRGFLPRKESDQHRWTGIKQAFAASDHLPPIRVYQVGQVYFVADGNHRVSVARQLGRTHIEARILIVRTRVPLSPNVRPDELALQGEYARFLERTDLDEVLPQADLRVTVKGQYEALEVQIKAHHTFLKVDQRRNVPYHEASASWYNRVYSPLVQEIRACGVLQEFPGRTETDLYLWLCSHRMALEEALGTEVAVEMAADDLVRQFSPRPLHMLARLGARLAQAVTHWQPSPSRT
jgi:hypothetical protein